MRSVWEKNNTVFVEREPKKKKKNRAKTIYRKMNLDGTRAIENLLSTNSQQINLSRCYQESIDSQRTSMDRTANENLSRSYRDKFKKASMDRDCINFCRERRTKYLNGLLAIESYQEAVKMCKNNFSKKKKKHKNECSQVSYSTKDSNNILNFQNHLSTRKMPSI